MSKRVGNHESVELRSAFEWTCPECGTDQFERAIAVEVTDDDVEQQPELADLDGDWFMEPMNVRCKQCNRLYSTREQEESDDDE